jgi:hypothetical protein
LAVGFGTTASLVIPGKQVEAALSLPPVPAGLKSTFMLGLSNSPGSISWMNGSGAKWDARYQYLAGGVNTGSDWSTWNTPAGAFATFYMNDSATAGYLPVLTYYMLLQSSPASGANESDKDYNNLNNPSTMQAYYANFKLLMDKAKAFGKTVIVHVEPDLWGYLQLRNSNPAAVSASVASSGYADVAAYPNTAAGFAQALVGLRNKYAPNVLLAYHISPWSSSAGDLGTSHSTSFNVQTAAQETANFYLKLGANYDLLFYDIADRDAAYYQSIGDPNHWWDVNNATYPNFNRFHQFASAITTLTNKRGILWQVPIGNTLYRSLNNTAHHWQDNRVQYYLNSNGRQQLQDLANSGIIGLLFGAGDGQTTTYNDAAGDGITNPAAINGNNLTSSYADDDSGYLRLQGQAYYAAGALALPSSTTGTPTPTTAPPTATPTTPPPTGNGTGLQAAYFANKTLSGTAALLRVDGTVNFNWGTGSPGTGVPADNFSARWTGTVKAVSTEAYTFCTQSDDGVRLWVNGVALVNNWTDHGNTENCGQLNLTQGQSYSLKLEYYENTGSAVMILLWQTPSITKQVVPKLQLYPGNTTPAPSPTPTIAPAPASWQMAATVSGNLASGSSLTIQSNFTAPAGASGSYLMDTEVYNLANGQKVAQWYTVQSFAAGQKQTATNSWQTGAGQYQVRMGVFKPDWTFLAWQNDGASFTVK